MSRLTFDANRARSSGLVSLPQSIHGASCDSCEYLRNEAGSPDRNIAYCSHPRIKMNVSRSWHCPWWSRHDAPLATPTLARRRFALSRILARFRRGVES